MKECPKCKKILNDEAKFCNYCGSEIREKLFCPNCGRERDAQAAFCQECGASLAGRTRPVKKPSKTRFLVAICVLLFVTVGHYADIGIIFHMPTF